MYIWKRSLFFYQVIIAIFLFSFFKLTWMHGSLPRGHKLAYVFMVNHLIAKLDQTIIALIFWMSRSPVVIRNPWPWWRRAGRSLGLGELGVRGATAGRGGGKKKRVADGVVGRDCWGWWVLVLGSWITNLFWFCFFFDPNKLVWTNTMEWELFACLPDGKEKATDNGNYSLQNSDVSKCWMCPPPIGHIGFILF